jgi:hypothetical protein
MPLPFNEAAFRQQLTAAQRQAQQTMQRKLGKINRDVQQCNSQAIADYNRQVDAHNRQVEARNRQAVADYNRRAATHNRAAERHNQQAMDDINRQIRSASSHTTVRYTMEERQFADRVQEVISGQDEREYDIFLTYARIDGSNIAEDLRSRLEDLEVAVWFDAVAIHPGKSQALQMDQGLRRAQAGVVVLTPAYLADRFWTERELGALLHKPTLIPVLHGVTFDDVKEYSGILPDLAGFSPPAVQSRLLLKKLPLQFFSGCAEVPLRCFQQAS